MQPRSADSRVDYSIAKIDIGYGFVNGSEDSKE